MKKFIIFLILAFNLYSTGTLFSQEQYRIQAKKENWVKTDYKVHAYEVTKIQCGHIDTLDMNNDSGVKVWFRSSDREGYRFYTIIPTAKTFIISGYISGSFDYDKRIGGGFFSGELDASMTFDYTPIYLFDLTVQSALNNVEVCCIPSREDRKQCMTSMNPFFVLTQSNVKEMDKYRVRDDSKKDNNVVEAEATE